MITLRKFLCTAFLLALICPSLNGCMATKNVKNQSSTQGSASRQNQASQPNNDTALRLARLLRDQGRYEGALGVYAKLDKRGVMTPLELLEYANVAALVFPPRTTLPLYVRAGKALSTAEVKPTPAQLCELHTGLGRARMAVGQYDNAIQDLEKALDTVPDHVAALNALGVLHDAQGDHVKARELFNKANEIAPSDVRILNNMALSYLSEGNHKQAVHFFNQATSFSDSPSIRLNQAFTYYMDKKMERAHSTLQNIMPRQQAATFMTMFGQMKKRVDTAESTISEELLRAANKLIEILPPVKTKAVNAAQIQLPDHAHTVADHNDAESSKS